MLGNKVMLVDAADEVKMLHNSHLQWFVEDIVESVDVYVSLQKL